MIRYIPLTEILRDKVRRHGLKVIDGGRKSIDDSLKESVTVYNNAGCGRGRVYQDPFYLNPELLREGYFFLGLLGLRAGEVKRQELLSKPEYVDVKSYFTRLFSNGQPIEVFMAKKF